MQRVLYLTEPTFDFSTVDSSSTLITRYEKNIAPGVYHTSLGDLPVDVILRLASKFDCVNLEPRGFDVNSNIFKESVTLHRYLSKQTKTDYLDPEQFTDHPKINYRVDQPMLWVFGCSHSHGVGLRPNEPNYGQLLSELVDLPLNLITKPGSSLHWSYRHLFNACIREHDIVIWQLTTPGRVNRFNGKQVEDIVLNSSQDRKLIDSVTNEQLYFNQISLLNTGVRFLRSIKCKFVISSIHDFGSSYEYISEYVKYPEYCASYGLHLDYGTDGIHAGPLSHQAIAKRLLDHIQCIDE